jgi:hypothetical protein
MFLLPVYLIPALLAVLIVGGLAILLLAIASCFGGSDQGGSRNMAKRLDLPSRFRSVGLRRPPRIRWADA